MAKKQDKEPLTETDTGEEEDTPVYHDISQEEENTGMGKEKEEPASEEEMVP